jgi:predicted Zn-dependent protease
MNNSTLRDLFILLVAGALVFLGGYYLVKYLDLGKVDLSMGLSIEQEEKLGDLIKENVWDKFERVNNPKVDSAMEKITGRLLGGLDSTQYRYRFRVIDNDAINAFTIPGGNIYIFSGLLSHAESPEEVAAVLSHEIGHAEQRHVVKKMLKEFSLGVVITVLSGGDPGLIIEIMQHVIGSKFDRGQEEEADEFGLELLEKSKIDPQHLADFFRRLNDEDLSYDKNLEFVMTHPHNDARINKVENYRTKRTFKEEKIDIDWTELRESIK